MTRLLTPAQLNTISIVAMVAASLTPSDTLNKKVHLTQPHTDERLSINTRRGPRRELPVMFFFGPETATLCD